MTNGADAPNTIDVEVSQPAPDEGSRPPLADRLEGLGHHVTQLVTTHPLAAVGIAVAVGFLLGRLVRH